MKLYCLACEVLARPLYLAAARSAHIVDIQLIQRGLHNQPANLRSVLQAEVDSASEKALRCYRPGLRLMRASYRRAGGPQASAGYP